MSDPHSKPTCITTQPDLFIKVAQTSRNTIFGENAYSENMSPPKIGMPSTKIFIYGQF